MVSKAICVEKIKNILNKHLVIHFTLSEFTYEEIELETLKNKLHKNVLNNTGILDTNKYIDDFKSIGSKVDCINIEDFIKDLKEFFKSKEFKDLQELEKKTWYHKLERLYKKLDKLKSLELNKSFTFKIDTLKVFIKNTLFLNGKINFDSNNGKKIYFEIKEILNYILKDKKEGGKLKEILKKYNVKKSLKIINFRIKKLKTKTYVRELY